MVKRAVEMEGTVTGEHGVGLVKRDYLQHELGESTVDAMRRVSSYFIHHLIYFLQQENTNLTSHIIQLKLAFDPLRLLNCDKVVRTEQPAAGEVKEW